MHEDAPKPFRFHTLALITCCIALLMLRSTKAASAQTSITHRDKYFVAYSLKAAESRVREAVRIHKDFRQDRELFRLGGMSKPKAAFCDPMTGDWILLGEMPDGEGDLTLDDLVVALRTRFFKPDTDPGVTIEPIVSKRDGETKPNPKDFISATRQRVVFLGELKNTEFGQTCYQADWLMKRLNLGLEAIPGIPIRTPFDVARQANHRDGQTKVVSRFWLCPVLSEVPVLKDQKAVFIEQMQMLVKTEVLYAERNGQAIDSGVERDAIDASGRQFAASLTDYYEAAAEARPVLERLRGLARLAGLAKGLCAGGWNSELRFFLDEYNIDAGVKTTEEVDVLHNEEASLGMTLRGGVQLRQLAVRLRRCELAKRPAKRVRDASKGCREG